MSQNDKKMTKSDTHFLHNDIYIDPNKIMYPYKLCRIRDYDKSLEKVWHVEYYIWDLSQEKLIRRRITLSENTAKARYARAKELVKEIDALLKKGAVYNKIKDEDLQIEEVKGRTKIKIALKSFLEYHEGFLSPNTLSSYKSHFKRFEKYLDKKGIDSTLEGWDSLDSIRYLDYIIQRLNLSTRTRNNNKDALYTAFQFFVKRKIINTNPWEEISDLPTHARKHTAFTKQQRRKVIAEIIAQGEMQLLLFVSFIFYTFLRPRRELRLRRVRDIQNGTIQVSSSTAKGRTTEYVQIPNELARLIEEMKITEYPEHYYIFGQNGKPGPEPIGENTLYYIHYDILKKLKLHKMNLDTYSWKHTGVIELFLATQDIELIRKHCRHKDIGSTQKYLRDLGLFINYDKIKEFPSIEG